MLDETVPNQFKVSNIPTLTRWNTSMSIREMLDQLEGTHGKPDTMVLFTNGMLFCSIFNPNNAPEALFYRIEQCQEIQVLLHNPYSDIQVINNAVRLLIQASIFPLKEFDDWEAITPKMYPALKTFIAAAYMRCILSQQLQNTAGQMGYVPQNHKMYTVLDADDITTATEGITTGSTLTAAQATVIPESVVNAINQLSANQAALMSQIAAMNLNYSVPTHATQQFAPPIQQLAVSAMQPFTGAAPGWFQSGAYGRGEQGGHSRHTPGNGCRGGHNERPQFANYQQRQGGGHGCGAGALIPQAPRAFFSQVPSFAAPYSNPMKRFANLNVCYSYGFDIEEGHMSVTCYRDWRKLNHQEGFTCTNAQEYINTG